MKSIIISFFFILLISFQMVPEEKPKLPINISFLGKQPPDSIQDFMKVYFQAQKLEVLKFEEVIALFQGELQTEVMDWVTTGKINKISESNKSKFSESLKPICNVLTMKIFRDTSRINEYIIDSIDWRISIMPRKDTNQVSTKFYPDNLNKSEVYLVLKSFSDRVISSGLLK